MIKMNEILQEYNPHKNSPNGEFLILQKFNIKLKKMLEINYNDNIIL